MTAPWKRHLKAMFNISAMSGGSISFALINPEPISAAITVGGVAILKLLGIGFGHSAQEEAIGEQEIVLNKILLELETIREYIELLWILLISVTVSLILRKIIAAAFAVLWQVLIALGLVFGVAVLATLLFTWASVQSYKNRVRSVNSVVMSKPGVA